MLGSHGVADYITEHLRNLSQRIKQAYCVLCITSLLLTFKYVLLPIVYISVPFSFIQKPPTMITIDRS